MWPRIAAISMLSASWAAVWSRVHPMISVASVDATGHVCIFNSERTHWIVDVSGYFTDAAQFFGFFPDGTDNL